MTSFTVFANLLYFVMTGKINERLPENGRISYFRGGTEVRTRFKQLYPGDTLAWLLDSSEVIMFLCFIFLIRFWVFG